MEDLAPQPNEVIARETKSVLCAVKFLKNKKRNFGSVLALCEKASLFEERDGQYLVAFSRDKQGVTLAMAALEEMRLASWKMILFVNGNVVTKANAFRNMLDCAQSRYRSKAKDFCLETFDSPMAHFAKSGAFEFKLDDLGDPAPEEFEWTLPCKQLNGFLSLSKSELKDPIQKIHSAGAERLLCTCPHFNADAFEIRKRAKKISRPKKYWD